MVGGLDLVNYSVHTSNPRFWAGRQLLLVYASAEVWDPDTRTESLNSSIVQHLTLEDCRDLVDGPWAESLGPGARSTVAGALLEPPSAGSDEPGEGTVPAMAGTLPRLLSHLRERHREAAAALEQAARQAARSAADLDRLRRVGRRLAVRARAFAADARSARRSLSEHEEALARLTTHTGELQGGLDRATERLARQEERLHQQAESLREGRQALERAQAALDVELQKTTSLTFSLARRDAELALASQRAQELSSSVAFRGAELAEAKRRAGDLSLSLDRRDAELAVASQRAQELSSSLARRDAELAEAKRRAGELDAALVSANAQLVAALNATTLRVVRNVAQFMSAVGSGKLGTATAIVRRSARGLRRNTGRESHESR